MIDANTHLTSDGRWFSTTLDASTDALLRQMDEAGIEKAAVVGLPGYIANPFVLDVCRKVGGRLLPVGSFNPVDYEIGEIAVQARGQLLDAGFVGVKLHPRFNRYEPLEERVLAFLDELAGWSQPLPVWLCTFFYFPGGVLSKSPVELIHELVGRYPAIPFVLAHGAGPDILRLAHAIRHCQNAFIDLSYTLSNFLGSSVEIDIKYLLETFDQRLIFGSDFPEVSSIRARADFDRLASDIDPQKYENIASQNLLRLIGLKSSVAEEK